MDLDELFSLSSTVGLDLWMRFSPVYVCRRSVRVQLGPVPIAGQGKVLMPSYPDEVTMLLDCVCEMTILNPVGRTEESL